MKNSIIILILFFNSSLSYTQWTQTNGPWGGTVSAVLVSGSKVFIGSQGHGVRYSTDNGLSWPQTSLDNCWVMSLAKFGQKMFAGTSAFDIYSSTDNGNTWINTPVNMVNIDCFIKYGSEIFVGGISGVLASNDDGITWVSRGLIGEFVHSLYVSGNIIFAGTNNGIFRSTDSGNTWSQTLLNNKVVYTILSVGSSMIAGTQLGIYNSYDNGTTWQASGLNNYTVYSLSLQDSHIYAGTWIYGLFLSSDTGLTWSPTSLNNQNVTCFSNNGIFCFAGTVGDGLLISSDSGTTWSLGHIATALVECLAVSGQDIFAGGWGVSITTNYGNNWLQSSFDTLETFTVSAKDNYVHVGTSFGVFRSTDYGISWDTTALNYMTVNALMESGPNILAGTDFRGGIYYSSDNGANWNHSSLPGGASENVLCFAKNSIYTFAGIDFQGIYISSDNGISWTQRNYLNGESIYSLAVSESNIYAGTFYHGIYISHDDGQNWLPAGPAGVYVRTIALSGTSIIAGLDLGGVCISTNNGQNWIPKNEGLAELSIWTLLIHDGNIYAGTSRSSAWKRPLSEIIGITSISNHIPTEYKLYQNYPNPFNPVTKIKFDIPNVQHEMPNMKLAIFNILGKKVAELVNQNLKAGTYETEWDASNFSSGIYFYELVAGDFVTSKKMMLIK